MARAPEYIKIKEFVQPTYGSKFSIDELANAVKTVGLSYRQGSVEEVIVDGYLTNLAVAEFCGFRDTKINVKIEALQAIPGKVEVMYYGK